MSSKMGDLDLFLTSLGQITPNLVEILTICNLQGLCRRGRPQPSSKVGDLDLFLKSQESKVLLNLVQMITDILD